MIGLANERDNSMTAKALLLSSLLASVLVYLKMFWVAGALKPSVLSFEFRPLAVLGEWSSEEAGQARRAIWWDFVFIPAYVSLFCSCTILLAGGNRSQYFWVGLLFPLGAGLLDFLIENPILLRVLRSGAQTPRVLLKVVPVVAFLKFALLLATPAIWLSQAMRS